MSGNFLIKPIKTLRTIEENELVAIHGKVVLTPESKGSVIHIFRFKDNLIFESWEASQQVLIDSPNVYGVF
ncbi:MAG: hypothetical protein ACP5PZ_00995 [Bacteroidales bacterium]